MYIVIRAEIEDFTNIIKLATGENNKYVIIASHTIDWTHKAAVYVPSLCCTVSHVSMRA